MNKRLLFFSVIAVIVLFFIFTLPANVEGEQQTKYGVLQQVEMGYTNTFLLWGSTENAVIITFTDGTVITCVEDDHQEAKEMYDYMTAWIGEMIVVGYTYDYGKMGYEIDRVGPA